MQRLIGNHVNRWGHDRSQRAAADAVDIRQSRVLPQFSGPMQNAHTESLVDLWHASEHFSQPPLSVGVEACQLTSAERHHYQVTVTAATAFLSWRFPRKPRNLRATKHGRLGKNWAGHYGSRTSANLLSSIRFEPQRLQVRRRIHAVATSKRVSRSVL